jgi:hypothetical protein
MIRKLVLGALMAALGAVAVLNAPDIMRYLRMRSM